MRFTRPLPFREGSLFAESYFAKSHRIIKIESGGISVDIHDSFNSYMVNAASRPQSPNNGKAQPPTKTPAAPRAPMEYERRSLIILRRPLWY